MPIYEFDCRACKKPFELMISFSRLGEARCPKCGSADVRRLMSTFAARTSSGPTNGNSGSSCTGCASRNCSACRH